MPDALAPPTLRAGLLAQLYRDEGLRLTPYLDTTGHLSIGCGRNLSAVGISEREAEILLVHDVDRVEAEVRAALPWAFTQLTDPRLAVLLNMAFNLGTRGLLSFRRTLASIEAGAYARAADEMLESKWARQVGDRALRLSVQMRTGRWVP